MTTELVPTPCGEAEQRNDVTGLLGTEGDTTGLHHITQDDVQLIDDWFLELSLPFHQTKVGLK